LPLFDYSRALFRHYAIFAFAAAISAIDGQTFSTPFRRLFSSPGSIRHAIIAASRRFFTFSSRQTPPFSAARYAFAAELIFSPASWLFADSRC
jgi:hypothetical protein